MAATRTHGPAVLLTLLLVSCGGGEPTVTARDLARIMPSAVDAPAGTTIHAEESGPKTLEEIAEDEQVRIKLRELGFRVGYVASFSTPNFDPAGTTSGSALYGSFAIVLKDATQAGNSFTFYQARLKGRAANFTPVVTRSLGGEAFAFRFSRLDDMAPPGLAYLWRVGNALFSVVGVGFPDADPDATRRLAELIDRRAKTAD